MYFCPLKIAFILANSADANELDQHCFKRRYRIFSKKYLSDDVGSVSDITPCNNTMQLSYLQV